MRSASGSAWSRKGVPAMGPARPHASSGAKPTVLLLADRSAPYQHQTCCVQSLDVRDAHIISHIFIRIVVEL